LLSALRKLFFWNYARNTWQWDALCVVILIFIFLTPKSWFENGERNATFLHQNRAETILLARPEVIESAEDKVKLEQQLRELKGRSDLKVLDVRKLTDADGKIKGYEVDIR
jgi:hypothetical protein